MRYLPITSCAAILAATLSPAHGQTPATSIYPTKAVRMVAIGPGGTVDFGARVLAQALGESFNQQFIVDNRPSGVIPGEIVAKAQPDGYTLLFAGGTLWVTPLLVARAPYDAVRDFSPVSLVYSVPYMLVVQASLNVKTVKELIALAKARPGELNYGVSGAGSSSSMAGGLFSYMAGINIQRIPFKSQSARTASLLAGEVQIEFASAGGAVASFIKAGKLVALGVTSSSPSSVFPGVAPIAQTVPGYEAISTSGLVAPARTPAAIINRLNQETLKALNRPDVKDKYTSAGVEVVGSSPERFATHIKSEVDRMGKVIKVLGIRGD